MTRIGRTRRRPARAFTDERSFHRWLAATLPAGRRGLLRLGDDATALRPPSGRVVVLSTDALVEGFHFLRGSPPAGIGRAATAVSLSDAASKGARPVGILLDLLVPAGTPEGWLRSVVRGAEAEAARVGAHVVGGDTKPSPVRSVVSTVIAWGDPRHLPPRSGARAGDWLVVTGTVGRGGLAFEQLERSPLHPSARALRAMLEVHPRVREGAYLARFATAMIDTSDGLADACHLLSEASGTEVRLEEERIPWAKGLTRPTMRRGRSRNEVGFFGGDYELLATVPPRSWPRVRNTPGAKVTRIGRVVRGRGAILVSAEGERALPHAGWQPFRTLARRTARR